MAPEELVEWRQSHGYTQKELAEILKVATISVYRWEKGMREIPTFLHLALECVEKRGGKIKNKGNRTKKEVETHGDDL